jgi:hypothetical protein
LQINKRYLQNEAATPIEARFDHLRKITGNEMPIEFKRGARNRQTGIALAEATADTDSIQKSN